MESSAEKAPQLDMDVYGEKDQDRIKEILDFQLRDKISKKENKIKRVLEGLIEGTQRPGNGSTLLAIFLGSFFWTDTHWLEDVRKQGFRIPYPSHRRSQLFGENPDIEVTPPVSILSLCSFPIRRSDADDSYSFFLLLLLRLRLIVCYLGLYIFSYCVYNEKRCYHENQ